MANKQQWYFDRTWPPGAHPEHRFLKLERDPGEDAPVPVPFPKPRPAPPEPPEVIDITPRPKPVTPRGTMPLVKDMPVGPFDPREALAWDEHVYPDAGKPPKLPLAAQLDLWLCVQARRFVDERGKPYEDDDKRKGRKPAPPNRQLPGPGDGAPPQLPAWMSQYEWNALDRRAEAQVSSGVISAQNAPEIIDRATRWDGVALVALDDYLRANGIRYFSAKEVTQHKWRHAWGRTAPVSGYWYVLDYFEPLLIPDGVFAVLPRYVVPPPELWPNILPALRILDRFRHWLGEPVVAISGYRHPWYNKQIDGSQPDEKTGDVGSFHMHFAAVDFYYRRWTSAGHIDSKIFVDWFQRLYRRPGDGVGRYTEKYGKFLHLDVGHRRDLLRKQGQNKADNWWRPKTYRGLLP